MAVAASAGAKAGWVASRVEVRAVAGMGEVARVVVRAGWKAMGGRPDRFGCRWPRRLSSRSHSTMRQGRRWWAVERVARRPLARWAQAMAHV